MKLDPRTKLIILAFTSIIIFFVEVTWVECVLVAIPFLLLALSKEFITGVKQSSFYILLLLAAIFLAPVLPTSIGSVVFVFSIYLRKLVPAVMLCTLLVKTTKVSEFLAAIGRLNLPKGFTIALSITLRYIPTLGEEYRSIKDAMMLRGIATNFWSVVAHPIKSMEYIYVPILTSATKIADEITCAAITRGIEKIGRRSCITKIAFSAYDILVITVYVATAIISIYSIFGGVA